MIVIFDIDGVLADCSHRLPFIKNGRKDWNAFFADENVMADGPIVPGLALWASMPKAEVYFVTGRPERTRAVTERWLQKHGVWTDAAHLLMRKDKDYRPACQVKREVLVETAAQLAIDDDPANCRMYVESGIPALLFMSEHSSLWDVR